MKVTRGASHWPLKCYFRDQQRWGTGSRQGTACIQLCGPPAPPRGCPQPGSCENPAAPGAALVQGQTPRHRVSAPGRASQAVTSEGGSRGLAPAPGVYGSCGRPVTVPEPAWTRQDHGQQAPTRPACSRRGDTGLRGRTAAAGAHPPAGTERHAAYNHGAAGSARPGSGAERDPGPGGASRGRGRARRSAPLGSERREDGAEPRPRAEDQPASHACAAA